MMIYNVSNPQTSFTTT